MYLNIALQRVSLGALIIALGLLVDDAMITVESMVTKLEEGYDKAKAAIYAYDHTHFPMGTGTLVTIIGFMPIGLRPERRRRIHLLPVRRGGGRAGRVVVRRRDLCAR